MDLGPSTHWTLWNVGTNPRAVERMPPQDRSTSPAAMRHLLPRPARETVPGGGSPDFQRLYEENGAFVHSLAKRLLGARGDPDDLTQEVFLLALRKLPECWVSNPRAWLCRVTVKLAANARRLAWLQHLLGLEHSEPLVDSRTPEQLVQAREATREVYAVLDTLSEKKRTVFILFEMQGLTCPEIAEALGCSAHTAYSRLHYARREFMARYLARFPDSGPGREEP
jgi:RNA polymerase sigma-70 factor (ECF subfamily)